jgi:hypothetical protein
MLRDLQCKFKSSILNQEENAIQSFIQGSDMQNVIDRVNVYRNNTFVSLKQALLSFYPVTAQVMSIEFFRFITDEFIRNFPPQNGSLLFYGDKFPCFLSTHESCKGYPFLRDLARLEWCLHECENTEDEVLLTAADFDVDDLEGIDVGLMSFVRAKHAHILDFEYMVGTLSLEVQNNNGVDNLNIEHQQFVLVCRDESFNAQIHLLSADDFMILKCLFGGKSMGFIVSMLRKNNIPECKLQHVLAFALEYGLFVKIS